MLKKEVRYDNYAYRIADLPASPGLIEEGFEEGMFLSFDENGELKKADGTAPAFMSMSSCRPGRNQFTGKTTTATSVIFGSARVSTTNFNVDDTYAAGTPLYVAEGGILTTTKSSYLVGYAAGEPTADGYLTVYVTVPIPVA